MEVESFIWWFPTNIKCLQRTEWNELNQRKNSNSSNCGASRTFHSFESLFRMKSVFASTHKSNCNRFEIIHRIFITWTKLTLFAWTLTWYRSLHFRLIYAAADCASYSTTEGSKPSLARNKHVPFKIHRTTHGTRATFCLLFMFFVHFQEASFSMIRVIAVIGWASVSGLSVLVKVKWNAKANRITFASNWMLTALVLMFTCIKHMNLCLVVASRPTANQTKRKRENSKNTHSYHSLVISRHSFVHSLLLSAAISFFCRCVYFRLVSLSATAGTLAASDVRARD